MRWSAAKLRWFLVAGVLLLTVAVAGFLGVARFRAGQIWRRILARNGVNLRQETDGFTWSQSSKGRTIFTLHASKATPLGNNRWVLHDAVLILYGREPGRDDRISGREFQYDQDAGVARAMGEVHMDLRAPEPGGKAPTPGSREALSFGDAGDAADDPTVIHVRTSGLVYMRKLGVAATGELTEFRYGGITCTSHGAEFDSAQSLVRLLADVHMTGMERGTPFALTATHAELSRSANTADLTGPVFLSGDRSARTAHALLHLRKDGSLQAAEANGSVEIREGTRSVGAPQATAVFGPEGKPQQARLFSGVRFWDADAERPAQGSADRLELGWNAAGLLQQVTAEGSARLGSSTTGAQGTLERKLAADQVQANFGAVPGARAAEAVLQQVQLTGHASLASTRGAVVNDVSGDELLVHFGLGSKGTAVAESLQGAGHTRLAQVGADGSRQVSTGDMLQVAFAPRAPAGQAPEAGAAAEVESALQTGHVAINSWTVPKPGSSNGTPEETVGRADRAAYTGATKLLTLTANPGGRVSVQQAGGDISAAQIVVGQLTGDAEATGSVIVTELGSDGQPATHVLANHARMLHGAGLTEFFGDTDRPAQLWQGGSQVQAAEIIVDQQHRGLTARPSGPGDLVHAVFATAEVQSGAASSASAGKSGSQRSSDAVRSTDGGPLGENNTVPATGRRVVRVSADSMDYADTQHQAVFAGQVRLAGVLGDITADHGVVTLAGADPSPTHTLTKDLATPAVRVGEPQLGGRLQRLALIGDVRLSQVGRTGIGHQLTYTAATDTFVLTGEPGSPPRVMGEQGSVVSGATLLFRSAESTIVVAGTEGGPKTPGGVRVHTETDLKGKP